MKKFLYTITNEEGFDAPTAGAFISELNNYSSEVTVVKNKKIGNARIIFNLLGLSIKKGDEIEFIVDGEDEAKEVIKLNEYLQQNL